MLCIYTYTYVQASSLSTADASKLTALLQQTQGSEDGSMGAPAAAVYKSASGGIVDTIQEKIHMLLGKLPILFAIYTTAFNPIPYMMYDAKYMQYVIVHVQYPIY